MKPRILHVITGLQVGGAEMMLVKTLPKLTDFEHTVCTVLERGPLADRLEAGGVRVVALDLRRHPFRGLGQFWRLSREKPGVTISYLIHADLFVRVFGRLFGLRKQVVFVRNNLIGSQYDKLLRWERKTNKRVMRYFSVSASVARMYQEQHGYDPKQFTVIPNGIEVEKFSAAKPLFRKDLGLEPGQPCALMVGKFYEQKGHDYLIEAWERVSKQVPDARLFLAGDGPTKDKIMTMVSERGLQKSVTFLGVRSDVPQLLKTADVFVFPTLFEGMSNALLEAMAAGCCILTTNIPENQEVAEEGQVRFVPPANSERLAEVLTELLKLAPGRRATLGKKAFEQVTSRFSIEQTVATLNTAYKELLS